MIQLFSHLLHHYTVHTNSRRTTTQKGAVHINQGVQHTPAGKEPALLLLQFPYGRERLMPMLLMTTCPVGRVRIPWSHRISSPPSMAAVALTRRQPLCLRVRASVCMQPTATTVCALLPAVRQSSKCRDSLTGGAQRTDTYTHST